MARLLLAAAPVTIFAPLARRGARRVRCWVVRVWEVDAPRAAEPIEWVLLSSLPVEDLESAREKAGWYAMRWLVEEFHKCLKTGCAVEKSQLATRARLEPQVGMLSVLAVRLLQAKEYARHQPDQPASVCVEEPYVRMMAAYLRTKPATLTIRRFIHAVASLGGFMGRSGDGEPGWQTIWEGWRQLELMLAGARIGLPDG